jgi:hypothetical protein
MAVPANGLEAVQAASFSGGCPPLGRGRHLEAAHEVERQHAQQLPGAIGCVAHRRHAFESETTLQLAVDLLVDPASAHDAHSAFPLSALFVTTAEYS